MCRLYANTVAFYVRDLSILRHGYPEGVLELIPCGYEGQLCNAFWNSTCHVVANNK